MGKEERTGQTAYKGEQAVQKAVSFLLAIVALIHLVPLTGALGPQRLQALYGLAFDNPDLKILMQHRAVLFGLLGHSCCTPLYGLRWCPWPSPPALSAWCRSSASPWRSRATTR
jgi:hypothetical protein